MRDVLAFMWLAGAGMCFGQAGRAELFGTIQDPLGLAIPKAKVEAEEMYYEAVDSDS